jgi:uncharacterized protein
MNKQLTLILSLTFLFLFGGSVYGDDFQDGFDADKRKDYKEAVRLYRLAAEQGNAKAQYNLGVMYAEGLGIPEDYKEAFRLFRLAAEQGDAPAQYLMGLSHYKGGGVMQDYVSAHMWWNLAAFNEHKEAVKMRKKVEKKMTPSQIEKAQEMARNRELKK